MITGQKLWADPYVYKGEQSFLLEYIDKCKSGEILIGHELMDQLDILIEHFNDPEIAVHFGEAHKRIDFIESKCKHFEAPFSGKPFILELFQKAFIESIYCFKIFDEEVKRLVRLYQDILYLVARKNGKTPLISAICLAEFFCGQKGTKILCSSNDYEQADLMFQAIDAMREESSALEKVTRKNIKGIYFGNPKRVKKKGKFSYSNKGSIRKISAKVGAKEGRNIGIGAVDEVHEMKDDSSVMPIRQALSTQDEPLYFELTTEGVVNDGYLDGRLKQARQVLDGDLERRRWLIWMYTQDNEQEIWQGEKNWGKSNPGIGVIKKRSFMRKMIDEARESKSTRVFVMSKDFNIKQNNASAWLSPEHVVNEETFDLMDFKNGFAIGGVDLSKTGDFCSVRLLLMRPNDDKKYFIQHYFIPESKLDNLNKEEERQYREWVRDGLITLSPGNENDFSLVTQWIYKIFKDYKIRIYKVGYDKWSAVYWAKEMEEYGFDLQKVDQQNWGSMSEPMRLLETDLKSGIVNYNNHPIDKYCLENTALKVNSKEEIMPVKVQGKEEKKIDGAVTMMFCYRVYIDNKLEFLELVKRTG